MNRKKVLIVTLIAIGVVVLGLIISKLIDYIAASGSNSKHEDESEVKDQVNFVDDEGTDHLNKAFGLLFDESKDQYLQSLSLGG